MLISDIKVSFLEYDYPLIGDLFTYGDIEIASVLDSACMKLTAISSRGSKKDFIDIYRILQDYDLNIILERFREKYSNVDYSFMHLMKSLVYFDDAEQDPELDYLEDIVWDEIKEFLKKEVNI